VYVLKRTYAATAPSPGRGNGEAATGRALVLGKRQTCKKRVSATQSLREQRASKAATLFPHIKASSKGCVVWRMKHRSKLLGAGRDRSVEVVLPGGLPPISTASG